MKVPPVELPINILRLISSYDSETGAGVNEVCRLTGYERYKQPVTNSIRLLEKAGMIQTIRSRHSQKRPKKLTDLGKEVISFINDIDRSQEVYLRFKQTCSEFQLEPREIHPLFEMIVFYERNIYNLLIFRYQSILDKFNANKNAKPILLNVLLGAVTHRLNTSRKDIIHAGKPFESLATGFIGDLANQDYLGAISNLSQEVRSLYSSMLCVCRPRRKHISRMPLMPDANENYTIKDNGKLLFPTSPIINEYFKGIKSNY